ncbi:protein kinase C-binding protein NELL1-like isoform X2 [Dysidea avara]|uniref:protein kinase C-binding protein NELL1-like isoform X2 n=1 Tax=Dysidea avara TaxID=196820 RepID=UPI0033270DC1
MGFHFTTVIALLACSSLVTIASKGQRCKVHPHEINLLKSVLLETEYLDNVDLTDGPSSKSPAIVLDGTHGINVDNTSLMFQKRLHQYSCTRRQTVFRASVKFDGVADGPIVFIRTKSDVVAFSLEVESDDATIKVGFIHGGVTFGVSFNYIFSDLSVWHNIIVSFDGKLVTVYVDCEKVGERVIMRPDYCLPDDLKLGIGGNPQNTEFFKGYLQDLVISFRESGIRKLCPLASTDCEYTASYQALNDTVHTLMATNIELRAEVAELKYNLSMMEPMTQRFTCFVDGKQHKFEDFFWREDGRLCVCSTGATARCTVPSSLEKPGSGKTVDPRLLETCEIHGEDIFADHYHTKKEDGNCTLTKCYVSHPILGRYIKRAEAPKKYMCTDRLKDCSEATKWTVEEKVASRCCGFCTLCDMQTDCPEHAECMEDGGDYTCKCKKGFIEGGGYCTDLDECSNGHIDKYGHYCPSDARCVNTLGGFVCQCPKGFKFVDQGDFSSTCENINECEDDFLCPNNLVCKDLPGSYECTCDSGNIRVGDRCIPHCDPPCHSAGTCVANNTCMCPGGLTGKYCESDINECDGSHGCSEHATCINFHGGYFCRCKDGYHGNGRTCTDINECANKETYDCPRTTTCKNTNGSYECECEHGDCRGGCVHNNVTYLNNGSYYKGNRNCRKCTCLNGTWDDCPCQCDTSPCCRSCTKGSCEIGGQVFGHNEEFIHPNDSCKNCTCKNGKLECTGKGLGFVCPKELLSTGKSECPKCEVEKCTATNDGAVHNNSCTECTCENNEWTCKKKVTCSPVTCKSTIIMGCCEVCDGSTNTRILSSSSTSGQPAFGITNSVTTTSMQPDNDDDDDGYC